MFESIFNSKKGRSNKDNFTPEKLREFTFNRPTVQEMLAKFFRLKENDTIWNPGSRGEN